MAPSSTPPSSQSAATDRAPLSTAALPERRRRSPERLLASQSTAVAPSPMSPLPQCCRPPGPPPQVTQAPPHLLECCRGPLADAASSPTPPPSRSATAGRAPISTVGPPLYLNRRPSPGLRFSPTCWPSLDLRSSPTSPATSPTPDVTAPPSSPLLRDAAPQLLPEARLLPNHWRAAPTRGVARPRGRRIAAGPPQGHCATTGPPPAKAPLSLPGATQLVFFMQI